MEEALDAGPILLQKAIPSPMDKTAGELAETLSRVGANLLIQTLDGLLKNVLNPSPQDEDKISWAPRITKEMALISWKKRALDVHNQIRAMNPWPVAHTAFRDERLQILRSMPEEGNSGFTAAPGSILGLSRNGLRVQCGEGTVIELLELKMPGKSRITGREFASGARLNPGESLKS
jgi:methionyl-tRNA formyltransferase